MVTTGMFPTNDTIEKIYSMVLMVLLSVNLFSNYYYLKCALAYSISSIS